MAGYIGSKTSVTVVSPETDSRYVNVTGDTMTGSLTLEAGRTYFGKDGANATWLATSDAISEPNNLGYGFASDGSAITLHRFYTNGLQRMLIDSDGRVTMPYQPAFHAQKNDAGNNNVTGNVIFNNAPQNIGGHYNTSNGRFTAPISGTYFFTVSVMKGSANGYGLYQVIKNGAVTVLPASGFVQGYTYSIANDGMTNISGSVFLNAGDYVTVFVSATYPSFYWGGYNVFSGFLVG